MSVKTRTASVRAVKVHPTLHRENTGRRCMCVWFSVTFFPRKCDIIPGELNLNVEGYCLPLSTHVSIDMQGTMYNDHNIGYTVVTSTLHAAHESPPLFFPAPSDFYGVVNQDTKKILLKKLSKNIYTLKFWQLCGVPVPSLVVPDPCITQRYCLLLHELLPSYPPIH